MISIHLKNSSDANYPYIELKNEHDGANSSEIRFLKQSSSADAGDDLGIIKFKGYSNGTTTLSDFCQIIGDAKTTTSASEEGQLLFKVKSGSSELDSLTINPTGVGIGTTNPTANLHIVHNNSGTYSTTGIKIDNGSSAYTISNNVGGDLVFAIGNSAYAYIENSGSTNTQINFTGQHRSILNNNITNTSVGLIVSTNGTYVNINNTLSPSINESLPICVLSNSDNDKKVFGVISDKEDTEDSREYSTGNFVSVISKTNNNEQRMSINSVGEGSIWVCNKNGNLENGDYITSTTVTGYGGKQTTNEGFLMNFTVAKITCDCDFSLTQIVKQKLKVTETTTDGVTTRNIDYDANGDVQYEDDLDENGAQQMVYKYETRFLQADGTQLVDEADYNTRLGNGESVYIACFVGCTYHCG